MRASLFDEDNEAPHGRVAISAVTLRGCTSMARRVDAGVKVLFVPFSQLPDSQKNMLHDADEGESVTLHINEWFAKKEGLI